MRYSWTALKMISNQAKKIIVSCTELVSLPLSLSGIANKSCSYN